MYRLFGTKESLKLLKEEKSTQFFIDSTYRCVPSNYNNTKALLLIVCYNSSADRFDLCCVVLLSHENGELLFELYNHLKNIYKFSPKLITYDFALANIKAVNIVFQSTNMEIILCFFHLVQIWWKKASILGLRKKQFKKSTIFLIFNLQLLPFLKEKDTIIFYKKLKEVVGKEKYEDFYEYFESTWLAIEDNKKSKFEFKFWSYSAYLNKKKQKKKFN